VVSKRYRATQCVPNSDDYSFQGRSKIGGVGWERKDSFAQRHRVVLTRRDRWCLARKELNLALELAKAGEGQVSPPDSY
jgi:hypothetical protein